MAICRLTIALAHKLIEFTNKNCIDTNNKYTVRVQCGMNHFCASHNTTSSLCCALPDIHVVIRVIACIHFYSECSVYDSADSSLGDTVIGIIDIQASKLFFAQLLRMSIIFAYCDLSSKFEVCLGIRGQVHQSFSQKMLFPAF